jgi:predicted alpha-1,2-mannosidase
MITSMLNDYTQSGCLPKWSVANYHTDTEDGDSADPIIAEAYAFGATGFNTQTALQAMIKGATTGCTSGSYIERQGLSEYLKRGYIPYGTTGLNGTASATLEYTNDDFAISQFAKAVGDTTDAATFATRAENWKKLYDPATGYIEARDSSGKFVSDKSGRTGFHGGTDAQYTWMIPYNVSGVISSMGGSAKAVSKLNTFFKELNAGKASHYAYMGNEPSSASPWAYTFAGQPWQTQSVVRNIETQLYSASTSGIPGNDDLGQMSAWYVWAAVGFFPEYPGAGNVVLDSPLFSQTTITLENGHQVIINATGAADNAPYVQSLSVNGVTSTSTWQPFSTLANGATFQYTLGTKANTSWGNTSIPPSF